LKKFATLLEEHWKGDIDLKQAVNLYKEHKVPDKFAKDLMLHVCRLLWTSPVSRVRRRVLHSLIRYWCPTDVEQEKLIKLLSSLKEENAINGNTLQDTFKIALYILDERENEIEKATNAVAFIFCIANTEHLTSLAEVASLTDNGAHYPLFLLVLQHLHQKRGKPELTELFNKRQSELVDAAARKRQN
jgi:translation initiation factor 4G